MGNRLVIATVNGGEWKLLYVNGEIEASEEEISMDVLDKHTPIESITSEWKVLTLDDPRFDAPDTYEEFCNMAK